jgi:GNAT superfamily N-acetyltransferase
VTNVVIRRADANDLDSILPLLVASLGWGSGPEFAAFFDWKHRENAFGESPAWIAVDGDRLVGLRILMRWEFDEPGGAVVRAVRAVDTATHPEYQGQGIFTKLTRAALEELEQDDVAFVFNTPNDKSRPGYVKMGWDVVGRLPVRVRPLSVRGLFRVAQARTAAQRWSEPSRAGTPAREVLHDDGAIRRLLGTRSSTTALRTRLTPAYLAWRYGGDLLEYRAVVGPSGLDDGVAIFRVRRRGAAREAALCEVVAAGDDAALGRELVRRVVRAADADYLLALGHRVPGHQLVPLPGQGPVLTWRRVATHDREPPREWAIGLGDIELF